LAFKALAEIFGTAVLSWQNLVDAIRAAALSEVE
jgi:hypothetical protein